MQNPETQTVEYAVRKCKEVAEELDELK